jgi:hypothetical protein
LPLTGAPQAEHIERTKAARELVAAAVAQGKVFTITGGYMPLRLALEGRGWFVVLKKYFWRLIDCTVRQGRAADGTGRLRVSIWHATISNPFH